MIILKKITNIITFNLFGVHRNAYFADCSAIAFIYLDKVNEA